MSGCSKGNCWAAASVFQEKWKKDGPARVASFERPRHQVNKQADIVDFPFQRGGKSLTHLVSHEVEIPMETGAIHGVNIVVNNARSAALCWAGVCRRRTGTQVEMDTMSDLIPVDQNLPLCRDHHLFFFNGR